MEVMVAVQSGTLLHALRVQLKRRVSARSGGDIFIMHINIDSPLSHSDIFLVQDIHPTHTAVSSERTCTAYEYSIRTCTRASKSSRGPEEPR
jgi:hypothetical protein